MSMNQIAWCTTQVDRSQEGSSRCRRDSPGTCHHPSLGSGSLADLNGCCAHKQRETTWQKPTVPVALERKVARMGLYSW